MIKIAALTAAVMLLLIAAAIMLAFRAGKAAANQSFDGKQAALHRDMARWINQALNGTSLDSDFWSSLSEEATKQAQELINRYRALNKI